MRSFLTSSQELAKGSLDATVLFEVSAAMRRHSKHSSSQLDSPGDSSGDVSSMPQGITPRNSGRASSPSSISHAMPTITSTIRNRRSRGTVPANGHTSPLSNTNAPAAEPTTIFRDAVKLLAKFPRTVRRKKGVAAAEATAQVTVEAPPPPAKRMRQDVFDEISDITVPHRPSLTSPDLQFPAYLEGVLDGTISFYQIDPRTWVGEVYDPTQLTRHHGVNKWAVVRAEYELNGLVRHWCSRCEDFKKYKACCHVLLLSHEDCPPFRCKSETG